MVPGKDKNQLEVVTHFFKHEREQHRGEMISTHSFTKFLFHVRTERWTGSPPGVCLCLMGTGAAGVCVLVCSCVWWT